MTGNSEPAQPTDLRPARLESVDLLRGLVMVIMALDHVRDFFSDRLYMDPVDLKTTTVGIFLTRWITHYCAPTFIFLAGTGAFLSGTRGKSKLELSWFLVMRGLWLVFLELTVIRASWYFNFDVYNHGVGVFWAIGWSMVVLAGLVHLPISAIVVFGVGMIAFHNLFLDRLTAADIHMPGWLFEGAVQHHLPEWLWGILHGPGDPTILRDVDLGVRPGPLFGPGEPGASHNLTLGTGYYLIPWMGVMAAGYGFGALMTLEAGKRRRELLGLGAALTLAFVILRAVNFYGDPRPFMETFRPVLDAAGNPTGDLEYSAFFTLCAFLNCTKYPPSLLFLLMTLGPSILALGLFEWIKGPTARRVAQPLIVFGRVPLLFYLLHLPLIHGGAVLLDYLRFGWSPQALDGPWAVRPREVPAEYGFSLPMVYVLWVVVVLILYPPCAWFAGVKQRSKSAWLSYL